MPQALLPLIPEDATRISDLISVVRQDRKWFYFCGTQAVFQHDENDLKSFRMFTAQLCVQGACKQADIIRAFGVSKSSVVRSVNKYRQEGVQGFFQRRRTRGAPVITPGIVQQAEQLFRQGRSKAEVARQLDVPYEALRKAVDQGRVETPQLPATQDVNTPAANDKDLSASGNVADSTLGHPPSDQSTRSDRDRAAGEEMGIACTRPIERVLASLGKLPGGATMQFEPCRDVAYGGVLCALPALVANGLFRHLKDTFPTLTGYYTTLHVMLLLAYMALCRIRTIEQLQYESPGELGKLMGLDRVPEVRCLRNKLKQLSQAQDEKAPDIWAGLLSKDWMEEASDLAGTLYVDGHVRLYWPTSEFSSVTATMPGGETVTMQLAERGSLVGSGPRVWMREVRKLTASGHQTSLISTAYGRDGVRDAVALFSRWCQENFFRYMMEHYAIDALSEYRTEEIPDTKRPVVNPVWRELDRQLRSAKGKLTRRQACFAALTLKSESDEAKAAQWEQQKSELREELEQLEQEVSSLKTQQRSTPHHLAWDEFPADAKFERLAPSRKRLTDTVKLVCYRSETALSGILRESLGRVDDSRSLLRDLFRSSADVTPDCEEKELTIRLHTLSNPRFNRALAHLLSQLNASETRYPGTDFRLRYTLGEPADGVTEDSGRDQES